MITVPGYFDRRQLAHEPVQELHNGGWAAYAEKSSRAEIIAASFDRLNPARDFGLEPLLNVHDRGYVEFLRSAYEEWRATGRDGDAIGYTWPVVQRRPLNLDRIDAKLGLYSYDAATPIAEGTWEASYWSAQTALSALSAIIDGEAAASFALCRPPGHHSGRDYCGGYCYLNNAAIAAEHARRSGRRVAILDIDYHHGNGTQDIFYERRGRPVRVDPCRSRDRLSFLLGPCRRAGRRSRGRDDAQPAAAPRYGHDCLWIGAGRSAGCGARAPGGPARPIVRRRHVRGRSDFLFRLRQDDYRQIGGRIASIGLPVLVVMEGGYAVDALGDNVEALLGGLDDHRA